MGSKHKNNTKKRQLKTNSVHTASGGDGSRPETELGALKKAGWGGEGARDTPKAAPNTHPVLGSTPRTARKKCRTGRNRTLDRSLHYWALTTYAYFPTAGPPPVPKGFSVTAVSLYISPFRRVSPGQSCNYMRKRVNGKVRFFENAPAGSPIAALTSH